MTSTEAQAWADDRSAKIYSRLDKGRFVFRVADDERIVERSGLFLEDTLASAIEAFDHLVGTPPLRRLERAADGPCVWGEVDR